MLGIGKAVKKFGSSFNPMTLLDPTGISQTASTVNAAAKALAPDAPQVDNSAITLPDIPGPQGVNVRDQTQQQSLFASGTQATGSEDLPGTGLFGPKKKAASRALTGY